MDRRASLVRQEKERSRHAEFLRDEKRKRLGRIADSLPNLRSVRLLLSFSDPERVIPPDVRELERGLENSAFFWVECYSHECVNGGFDLTEEIEQMVKRRQAETSGSMECGGWQDPERIGRHRCWCRLEYKISCTYSQ
jgi:hypothetical protein